MLAFGKILCRLGIHRWERDGFYGGMACERYGCPANRFPEKILIDRQGVAYPPIREVKLQGKK